MRALAVLHLRRLLPRAQPPHAFRLIRLRLCEQAHRLQRRRLPAPQIRFLLR